MGDWAATTTADETAMIWSVAALAALLLCFVVVYGTCLHARIEANGDPHA